jgi:hypothetical protein
LNRRIRHRSQNPLAHPFMDSHVCCSLLVHHLLTCVHIFPDLCFRRRTLLDDAGVESKVEVSGILVVRINPAVADEETLELRRDAVAGENGLGNVRNVLACEKKERVSDLSPLFRRSPSLTCVGFAGDVGLSIRRCQCE